MRTEFNIKPEAFAFATEMDATKALLGEFETPNGALRGRTLTYTTRDVIDQRISVPAQHSLVRLSKNPVTSADAVGLLEAVKAGRLGGIFCVNWQKPAQRAIRLGKSWWTVIPPGEDAVLMLDPGNPTNGQPLIAFRRELDPRPKQGCGRLPNEKLLPPSPSRLDAALRKAWSTYTLFRNRRLTSCTRVVSDDGVIAAELAGTRQLSLVPRNLSPPILCSAASADPGEVRKRCQQLGCPLFATCSDDGTEMFLTECGRGPCPFCPPGFDELLVRAYVSTVQEYRVAGELS